jgi:dTDP-4-amino-4,6-dideoxygalactose transaminase
MDEIRTAREALFERYQNLLASLESDGFLRLPKVPAECRPSYHLFYVLCRDEQTRDELLDYCHRRRIGACFHYVPLHCSPMGARFGYGEGDLPVTERLSSRLLRLPLYAAMTEEDQSAVVECLQDFFAAGSRSQSHPERRAGTPE